MSVVHSVFLGPYAEFPVPPGRKEDFPPMEESGEFLGWEDLHCNIGVGHRHEDCYRYTPARDKQAGRRMFWWGERGALLDDQDLTDLDRQAEMDRFAREYHAPLQLLEAQYGKPPRIRWGLVFWLD